MAEHLVMHDCPTDLKDAIEDYWTQKRGRLDTLLQTFPEDQRHLRLVLGRHPNLSYQAHITLRLPTGTLVAQHDAKSAQKAIDTVLDKIAEEIRRHKGWLRRGESYGASGKMIPPV